MRKLLKVIKLLIINYLSKKKFERKQERNSLIKKSIAFLTKKTLVPKLFYQIIENQSIT